MDNQIMFALIGAVVLFGSIGWLVVYSRSRSHKHTMQTSIKPPETESKNRPARS